MHAFSPLAPVVILAHYADFSAFGWLCCCHPTYEQRPVLACFVGTAESAFDSGMH